jgi:hypothetical protein
VILLVLLNLFGKIDPTTISTKLGIGLCNPDYCLEKDLKSNLEEEFLLYNFICHREKNSDIKTNYDFEPFTVQEMIRQLGWHEDDKSQIQIIAEHLIEIQVSDFNHSLLKLKNNFIDSPTCEPEYPRKFLEFCRRIHIPETMKRTTPNQIPFLIYSSQGNQYKHGILNNLGWVLSNHPLYTYQQKNDIYGGIRSLQYIGHLIDHFLESDEDFWLLDYILNAISIDQEQNAYYIFKIMSIIEMLIINPKRNGKTVGEIERKLPNFLSKKMSFEKRVLFSKILRKLRNKIAHGDQKAVQQLLKQYRQNYMKDFQYDEGELSIENWTFGHICIYLDRALSKILWFMLSHKAKWLELQIS